ncbi:MAG: glycosyltransferase domain-containing protein [Patescibacteria group bacterium]
MQKTVIYTAIFGNHEQLREPEYVPSGCDFVCFTNNELRSRTWDVRTIPPPHPDPRLASRHVKILAHKYFPEYEESVYIDGNLIVTGNVHQLCDTYLESSNMAVYNHAHTSMDPVASVREESIHLIQRTRAGKFEDDPKLIASQLHAYLSEGFIDNQGVSVNMILLRRHNAPDVIKAMELWWSELLKFSKRDQMSFNYVAWKTGLKFNYIDGDSRNNPYFKWVPHEDIPYLIRKWHKFQKLFR